MVLGRAGKGCLPERSGQDDMAGGLLSDVWVGVFLSYPHAVLLLCNNAGLEEKNKINFDYYFHFPEPLLRAAWRLLDNSAPSPGFLDNAYKIFFLKPGSEEQISYAQRPLQTSPRLKSQSPEYVME